MPQKEHVAKVFWPYHFLYEYCFLKEKSGFLNTAQNWYWSINFYE